jgi:hypothetical protein
LDNFRVLRGFGWSEFTGTKLWKQDKGHMAEMAAVIKALETGAPAPIPFEEIYEVTETTFRVATAAAVITPSPA